jgi:predicted acetylornithine/succinylornithine family transaminase
VKAEDVINWEQKYLVPTYVRPPVVFTHGKGAYLFDDHGRRYLDFSAGIAVTSLGHSDDRWVNAVSRQAGRLAHVSNLYHTTPQVQLARRLVTHSFADKVFFCNSGSEANETALKFARKYARVNHNGTSLFTKTGIVAFTTSFHGRTMGALSTTAKSQYRKPFEPLLPGVNFATFNSLDSAARAISSETCAVIVEPVQGEGGVNPAGEDFLKGVRQLCDENKALLIFDEVQCGLGRTGSLWAHEQYDVTPDMMTLAKPLAGGLPIGATLVTQAIASAIRPGDHGNTFAGGPLVCTAANHVFDRINNDQFLSHIRDTAGYLIERLQDIDSSLIRSVRGSGLLVGVELSVAVMPLIAAARERGLLVINAGENVLRLCPPLIIGESEVDTAIEIIESCLEALE